MTKLEEVARAIDPDIWAALDKEPSSVYLNSKAVESYDRVRAAIALLKNPSEAIKKVMWKKLWDRNIWMDGIAVTANPKLPEMLFNIACDAILAEEDE